MKKNTVFGSIFILLFTILFACTSSNEIPNVDRLTAYAKPEQRLVQTTLGESLAPAMEFESFGKADGDRSFHSNMLFLEVVLSYGPPIDPRYIFLLVNSYIVTNQQRYGINFLERLVKRYDNSMNDQMRSSYMSAHALLRATYASRVAIHRRIGWVLDTFEILERANKLDRLNPLVHWATGLIYAQVPRIFGKRDAAIAELLWLAERPETEPTPGFYREAYHYLAKLYAQKGDVIRSKKFLLKSGYEKYEPDTLFMGWFATSKEKGLSFSPTPWIEEIVAGRVYAVRGFGFSDLHFVVSEDRQHLISIDAGTQPYSMRLGYQFLVAHNPKLPPLTTVFITHAHWDHIGGLTYLRSLNQDLKVYGRENYHNTLARVLRKHSYTQFRGADFNQQWISAYKPDITVEKLTEVSIGNTVFELIPVAGGETEDAMLISIPELSTIFMGDALMPFYGEPWVEEGDIDEALNTMDEALLRRSTNILHGHYGITVMYGANDQLESFRDAYKWLVTEVRKYIRNGYSVKNIIRLNLIPPGLQNIPQVFFGYLSPRDHIIARTADHMVGIWQEDKSGSEPEGLDVITSIEYGRLLGLYLELSVTEVVAMLHRILDGGDNSLALQMATAAASRYPNSDEIIRLKRKAADRLRSTAQYFDPFKFVTYTEKIGVDHARIPAGAIVGD